MVNIDHRGVASKPKSQDGAGFQHKVTKTSVAKHFKGMGGREGYRDAFGLARVVESVPTTLHKRRVACATTVV